MSKMLVVVFDDEKKAYEGSRGLADLHREGSITAYAAAVVSRDASGKVSVKDDFDQGPIATVVGMMTGALVGVLAGPEGMIIGGALGATMGGVGDLINLGVGADFVGDVADKLQPGKVAVVAEVGENWITPVDTRMAELGGTVYRRYRADVEDEQIERDIEATRQELHDLRDEIKEANDENKAKLKTRIAAAEKKLSDAGDRAKSKMASLKEESDAKLAAVKKQIADAKAERKAKLEQRSEEIKTRYAARQEKLKQAWELTRQALGSHPEAGGSASAQPPATH